MKRLWLLLLASLLLGPVAGAQGRAEWVEEMTRIAGPVLENLAQGNLKANMPFESLSKDPLRKEVSYLEAFGRTVCGIAPWLELGPDETPEGRLRAKYIDLTVKAFQHAVDPDGPDRLVFDNRHTQPLVDAAFLAEGVLRAPTQIWGRLDARTRQNLVDAWKTSRSIRPYESNWLLFASIIEAALLEFTGDCQPDRLYDGVTRFRYKWYKGDAWYGDGEDYHLDYYNSLVIHPMLTEVLQVLDKHAWPEADFLPEQLRRHGRFAAELERLISPEGTFPVIGRSIAYRFGAFHALADAALLHILPEGIDPAQVRCALGSVIRRPPAGRRAGDLRRKRLAPRGLRRQPAPDGRRVHQHRQPLPVHGRFPPPRPPGIRSVLEPSRRRLDLQEGLERCRRGRGPRPVIPTVFPDRPPIAIKNKRKTI